MIFSIIHYQISAAVFQTTDQVLVTYLPPVSPGVIHI